MLNHHQEQERMMTLYIKSGGCQIWDSAKTEVPRLVAMTLRVKLCAMRPSDAQKGKASTTELQFQRMESCPVRVCGAVYIIGIGVVTRGSL